MSEQIILNWFDSEGDNKLKDFFKQDYPSTDEVELFKQANNERVILETDADFEGVFTKVAETYSPTSWTELKEKVASLFGNKLDSQFERWETKMALDKTALTNLFS
ncbi:MAG: hypothetical protein H8E12_16835 [Rhodobacteraceae bacterium]|nr:hypothetical protein [Paracoccaceae bacterium]